MCFASGGSGGPRMATPMGMGFPRPAVRSTPVLDKMSQRFQRAQENRQAFVEQMKINTQRGSAMQKPLTPKETEQMRSEQAAWASRSREGADPYTILPQSRQESLKKMHPQLRLGLAVRGAGGFRRG